MCLLCGSLGVFPPKVVYIDDETMGVGTYELAHTILVHPLVVLRQGNE